MADPKKVALGTELILWSGNKPVKAVVQEGCTDVKGGRWYCVTDSLGFVNQMEKDFHISEESKKSRPCTLAWICFTHGPEVP